MNSSIEFLIIFSKKVIWNLKCVLVESYNWILALKYGLHNFIYVLLHEKYKSDK